MITIVKRIAKNGKDVWRLNLNGSYFWHESWIEAWEKALRGNIPGPIIYKK